MKSRLYVMFIMTISFMMCLNGCGGGGGGGSTSTVSGVAAAGAPLVGKVFLKDSSTPAKELSTAINADGSFSFNVDSLIPPFILKSEGVAGNANSEFYSLSLGTGIANINPLSHLAIVQANNGIDPAILYANPSSKIHTISAALPTIINDIQTKLSLLLSHFNASNINFISDSFQANHRGLDELFDYVVVKVANGTVTVSNKVTGGVIFVSGLSTTLNGTMNINNIPNHFSTLASWEAVPSGTKGDLYDIAYANGIFVAVGENGTILRSVDGISWQPCTSGISTSLNGIIYGNGLFVAIGSSGKILTSTDGSDWTMRDSGTSASIGKIAFGNDRFVAIQPSGSTVISTDGVTWIPHNTLSPTYWYNGIAFGNGLFVAVNINSEVFTSTDGYTWQSNSLIPGTQLQSITYGNDTFVAAGVVDIITSTSGTSWQYRGVNNVGQINGITYCYGAFVAVGRFILISDADGRYWWKMNYEQPAGTTDVLLSVAYGKGTLVTVGENGTIRRLGQ